MKGWRELEEQWSARVQRLRDEAERLGRHHREQWRTLHQTLHQAVEPVQKAVELASHHRWWQRFKASPEPERTEEPATPAEPADHLDLAKRSLRQLLADHHVPDEVREAMAEEYRQVEEHLGRLEEGQVWVAVCGRVSVGKSALINALIGEERFSVSPLHGETRSVQEVAWREVAAGSVILIDTPGINEVEGAERERLALEVVRRSDLAIFVVDGDLTDSEFQIMRQLTERGLPILLILNKADRYTTGERQLLLDTLVSRTTGMVAPASITWCSARPSEQLVIRVSASGEEETIHRTPEPEMTQVRLLLWHILEAEGKSLAALNATLFAGRLTDQVTERIMVIRRELAEQVIHTYCLAKGVAVAFNPVPLADLLTTAVDAVLVVHLGRLYGLTVNAAEASQLVWKVVGQLVVLMGTILGVQLASSAMKGASFGLSTLFTASTQGAAAYFCTYVVGKAAQDYFSRGRSWGAGGPKQTVQTILETVDRHGVLAQAREEILARLR